MAEAWRVLEDSSPRRCGLLGITTQAFIQTAPAPANVAVLRQLSHKLDHAASMEYEANVRVHPALPRLIRQLAEQPHVRRVWLFGSRARGDARQRSDIDLAIEAPAANRRDWLEMCRLVEEADTLLPIDVVRLEEASHTLRSAIHKEGRVLFER